MVSGAMDNRPEWLQRCSGPEKTYITGRRFSAPCDIFYLQKYGRWQCPHFFALWFADSGLNKVSRQWRCPQGLPLSASCSCTPCCPKWNAYSELGRFFGLPVTVGILFYVPCTMTWFNMIWYIKIKRFGRSLTKGNSAKYEPEGK